LAVTGEDVHVAAADFDDEEHVQALQGERAVDMEEVAGQHGRRLGAEEPSPGGVVVADRRWWDPAAFEDPADRGRADPMAEAEQFALDALVAPAGIVSGHLFDQGDDGRVDGWAAGTAGICPVSGDQPPVPTEDRSWGDQPVRRQRSG
jgi:hypothetical protein